MEIYFDNGYSVGITEDVPFAGVVLILSFEQFEASTSLETSFSSDLSSLKPLSTSNRVGGEKDRQHLLKLFSDLGYNVSVEINKTKKEVEQIIHHIGNGTHISLFICIILSHGCSASRFLTSDGESMCIKTDVMNILEASNNLKNCVKIYIGNFCRDGSDESATTFPGFQMISSTINTALPNDSDVFSDSAITDLTTCHITNTIKTNLSKTILVFSSLPGNESFRSEKKGSLFIQNLIKIIRQNYSSCDFVSILELTNEKLQHNKALNNFESNEGIVLRKQAMHYEVFDVTRKIYLSSTVNFDVLQWLTDCANLFAKETIKAELLSFMPHFAKLLFVNFLVSIDQIAIFYKNNIPSVSDISKMDKNNDLSPESLEFIVDILTGKCFFPTVTGLRHTLWLLSKEHKQTDNKTAVLVTLKNVLHKVNNIVSKSVDSFALLFNDLKIALSYIVLAFEVECTKDIGIMTAFNAVLDNQYSIFNAKTAKSDEILSDFEHEHIDRIDKLRNQMKHMREILEQSERPSSMRLWSFNTFTADYESSDNKIVYYKGASKIIDGVVVRHGKGAARYQSGATYIGFWVEGVREGHGEYLGSHFYDGEWRDDMLNGHGTIEYNNGIKYSGIFVENTMHGEGTMEWPDGSTYCGRFEWDRRCGYGEYSVDENHQPNEFRPIQGIVGSCDTTNFMGERGLVYKGQWKDNVRNGFGTQTFTNNYFYSGEWVGNDFGGTGVYTFPDGSTFDGEWTNGLLCGQGVVTGVKDGIVHSGEWLNTQKHGHFIEYSTLSCHAFDGFYKHGVKSDFGTLTMINGDVYSGEWDNDNCNGTGKLVTSRGTYEGQFVDDQRSGYGIQTFVSGDKYEGEFRNNEAHGFGKYTYSDGSTFTGHWSNGVKSGQGVVVYSHGATIEAEWVDDKICGRGKLTLPNGDCYDGEWLNDMRHGQGVQSYGDKETATQDGEWRENEFVSDVVKS